MKTKIILGTLVFLLTAIVINVSIASAEFWVCFGKGDRIDYCNPRTPDRTCKSNSGCFYCMDSYDETRQCYNQGNWMLCNTMVMNCSVSGNTTIDGTPPEIVVNNPIQGDVYDKRSMIVDIDVNERASIYYYDNIYGRGKWKRICSGCEGYTGKRSFKEGFNDLTFRAVDSTGNAAYFNVSFFIDSKKPKISRTYPKKGFANGEFEVQFSEKNPASLVLNYGNYLSSGFRSKQLNINDDCYIERKRYYCNTDVGLNDYDGQDIEYWFELMDMANTSVQSRHLFLSVDTTFPVIEFLNYSTNKRYVEFNIEVTEENFEEISYYDYAERRPGFRRLCNRLKDGVCKRKKSFTRGQHVLDIQVMDEAGNSVAQQINFIVDY